MFVSKNFRNISVTFHFTGLNELLCQHQLAF